MYPCLQHINVKNDEKVICINLFAYLLSLRIRTKAQNKIEFKHYSNNKVCLFFITKRMLHLYQSLRQSEYLKSPFLLLEYNFTRNKVATTTQRPHKEYRQPGQQQ